ncbi:hypothetical protein R3P82_12580 [Dietzia maris]|uniref:Uncharacterized protein n=1 Tax=Dietzia maris TaxID=37915 RepID=A0AAE4QXC8_9ACTN|nr:hypothetical protein [Dietzia maris]MDV6299945.1 hypothetical protein [Dietzia maris]
MTDQTPPIVQHCNDLAALDEVLGRVCQTDTERTAIKRLLGVDMQERAASDAFTPERPPQPGVRDVFDHAAHTREAIARYTAWVDSYPDDDPTPLFERRRVLEIALSNLSRLEQQ